MGSQRVGHDWATELNWLEMGRMVLRAFWDALSGLESLTLAWIKCAISFLDEPIYFCLLLDVTSPLTPIQLALLHFLWSWEIWAEELWILQASHVVSSTGAPSGWLLPLVLCWPHTWHGNVKLWIARGGAVCGTTCACWLLIFSKPWLPSSPRGYHSGLSVRCRWTVDVLWTEPWPGQSVFYLGVRPCQAGFSWCLSPSALSEMLREAC